MLSAMRRLALFLLLPLVAVGCPGTDQNLSVPDRDADNNPPDAAIEAEAAPPQPLKVMTLNTYNFFNDVRDSYEIPAADEQVETTANYQTKLAAIAAIFTQENPNVAILQEVENIAVLNDLANAIGSYPHREITQGNDPRGIDIGVMSQVPFQVAPSHKDEYFHPSTDPTRTYKYARDLLEVHMKVNGRHVVFGGVHFKAEIDAESQLKRLAEAEHTREISDGHSIRRPERGHHRPR